MATNKHPIIRYQVLDESLILSFSLHVEVVSPIFLREQIRNHIVHMNEK